MASVSSPISRGRILRQQIPTAPPTYDQTYLSQLAAAVNNYMTQAMSPGDVVGARFICSDPIIVGTPASGDPNADLYIPDVSTLPTGMLYLIPAPGGPAGTFVLTMVLPPDPAARGVQPTNKL